MKAQATRCAVRRNAIVSLSVLFRNGCNTGVARWLTPCLALAVLCGAALQADAATAIFAYVNGNAVNVTAVSSIVGSQVYEEGAYLGSVNGAGQIVNNGQIVGYVVTGG